MDNYFKFDQPIDRKLAEKPVTGNEPDAEILNIDECSINQF